VSRLSGEDLTRLPWRVGRKVRRNLYAVVGDQPSDGDYDIGRMDDAWLAARVVSDHNATLNASNEGDDREH
jgi:hypothetical protein